jgi:hypothetical protein
MGGSAVVIKIIPNVCAGRVVFEFYGKWGAVSGYFTIILKAIFNGF